MKKSILQMAVMIATTALLIGCGQVPASGQDEHGSKQNSRTIEGVWQTKVTPRNCQTGDPLGPVFPGIIMFNHGGTMTGTSTAVTSVYGTWRRTHGQHEYTFSTIALRSSPAGVLLGTRQITQNISLERSGDSFTSDGEFRDFDISGILVASGCATSVGTRFE